MSASPAETQQNSTTPEAFYEGIAVEAKAARYSSQSAEEKKEILSSLEKEMEKFEEERQAELTEAQKTKKRRAEAALQALNFVAESLFRTEEHQKERAALEQTLASKTDASEANTMAVGEPLKSEEIKKAEQAVKESGKNPLIETDEKTGNKTITRVDEKGEFLCSAHMIKNEQGGMDIKIYASTDEGKLQAIKDSLAEIKNTNPNASCVTFPEPGAKNAFSEEVTYAAMQATLEEKMTPCLKDKSFLESGKFFAEQAVKRNTDPSKNKQEVQHDSAKQYFEQALSNKEPREALINEMVAQELGTKEELESMPNDKLVEKCVGTVMPESTAEATASISAGTASESEAAPEEPKDDKVEASAETEKKASESDEKAAKEPEVNTEAKAEPVAAASSRAVSAPRPTSSLGETAAKTVGEEAKANAEAAKIAAMGTDAVTTSVNSLNGGR